MERRIRLGTGGLVRRLTSGLARLATRTVTTTKSALLGSNLVGVSYFAPTRPFLNLWKLSSNYVTTVPSFDAAIPINIDSDGEITSFESGQTLVSYLFSQNANGIEQMNVEGQYLVVDYTGDGANYGTDWTFVAQGGSVSVVDHDTGAKRLILNITLGTAADQYLYFQTNAHNAADKLRIVSCVQQQHLASFEAGQLFHPEYLDYCRRFSTLRFMDWMNTNGNDATLWSDRRAVTHRNYSGGSWTNSNSYHKPDMVPYEIQAALCNEVGANLWTTTPYAAITDWASNAATTLLAALDSSLSLFIERANETWNGIFAANTFDYDAGQILYPGEPNVYYRGWKASAHYARLVMEDFEAVWTGDNADRLHTMFCWQKNTDAVSAWLVEWEDLESHIRHWGIAPYMAGQNNGGSGSKLGTDDQATVAAVSPHIKKTLDYTVDEVVDDLFTDLTTELPNYDGIETIMSAKGISIIDYEGGQHLVGVGSVVNNTTITDLFVAANRSPRMRQLYYDYYTKRRDQGCELMMVFTDHYQPDKYGSWGAKEYQGQPDEECPKYLGILDFISENPA